MAKAKLTKPSPEQERRPQNQQATLQADIQAAIRQLKVWADAEHRDQIRKRLTAHRDQFLWPLGERHSDSFMVFGLGGTWCRGDEQRMNRR